MLQLTKESKADVTFNVINYMFHIIVLILVLYPLVYIVSASFSNPMHVMQGKIWLLPEGFTVQSYIRVFKNVDILVGYKNSLIYMAVGTAVNLVMTILGAYPLSRRDLVGRNFFMGFMTFTMFFSGGLIPTYLVIKSLGLYNSFWVMILPGAISMWNLIIMRTFFQTSIPYELQESAFIDGCSNPRILISIVLPLSAPIIAVTVLFYAVAHWDSYFTALIYLTDKSQYPLQLVLRQILIQNQVQDMMNSGTDSTTDQLMLAEGLKYAVIVVSSVPMLILYPFVQRYFVKGIMVGAIKG
ncbi:MAG: carbohydrate transporter rane protein 2, family [Paenibacillus sp.]|nr:carbohydrate transporter rane protein 2, family [Paenibacillus sp.]